MGFLTSHKNQNSERFGTVGQGFFVLIREDWNVQSFLDFRKTAVHSPQLFNDPV